MNNIDVDNLKCSKDAYGNLIPNVAAIDFAAQENSNFACDDPEDPEESYWW
jgi:hypothetical protein